jgi:leucyl-tRNA synthetase
MLADASWPEFDAAAATEPQMTLVVQVAGKVRDRLSAATGLSEERAGSTLRAPPSGGY